MIHAESTKLGTSAASGVDVDARLLYLDLMKKSLIKFIYGEQEYAPVHSYGIVRRKLIRLLTGRGVHLLRAKPFDPQAREEGLDYDHGGHTMIGLKRLNNLQFCIEDVLQHNTPGDLIETGVWRGGATIFMRACLKAYSVTDRTVWVADSFEGLPPPDFQKYPNEMKKDHSTVDELKVSLEQVKANFEKYGLLDEQVRFLKGWFRGTLPDAPIAKLALMRLDGDMYESTMDALGNLYPKLSVGGYVIVDDYGAVPECAQAVQDYRKAHDITDTIHKVDWTGVFWQRSC